MLRLACGVARGFGTRAVRSMPLVARYCTDIRTSCAVLDPADDKGVNEMWRAASKRQQMRATRRSSWARERGAGASRAVVGRSEATGVG